MRNKILIAMVVMSAFLLMGCGRTTQEQNPVNDPNYSNGVNDPGVMETPNNDIGGTVDQNNMNNNANNTDNTTEDDGMLENMGESVGNAVEDMGDGVGNAVKDVTR